MNLAKISGEKVFIRQGLFLTKEANCVVVCSRSLNVKRMCIAPKDSKVVDERSVIQPIVNISGPIFAREVIVGESAIIVERGTNERYSAKELTYKFPSYVKLSNE